MLSVRDPPPPPLSSRPPSPHPSPARIKLLPLFRPHPEALSSRYFAALRRPARRCPGSGGPKGWDVGGRVPPPREPQFRGPLLVGGREAQLITECGREVLPFCTLPTFPRAGVTGPFCQGDAESWGRNALPAGQDATTAGLLSPPRKSVSGPALEARYNKINPAPKLAPTPSLPPARPLPLLGSAPSGHGLGASSGWPRAPPPLPLASPVTFAPLSL